MHSYNNNPPESVDPVTATTGMIVWEAMIDLRDSTAEDGTPAKAMDEAWDGQGSFEMRDAALQIAVHAEKVFALANAGDFIDGLVAFDFDFIPWLVSHLDWSTARPVPDLPDVAETAIAFIRAHREHLPGDHSLLAVDRGYEIVERFERFIDDDGRNYEKDNARIADNYLAADDNVRSVIDDIFISLCGYSLATLMKREDPS